MMKYLFIQSSSRMYLFILQIGKIMIFTKNDANLANGLCLSVVGDFGR